MVDDAIAEFVAECTENLDRCEQGMLALEQNPGAPGVLDDMFRAIHTIKGSSGLFDSLIVGRISHAGENLMSALREGRVSADAVGVSTLLEMADVLRRPLNGALLDGHEPAYDKADLVERPPSISAARSASTQFPICRATRTRGDSVRIQATTRTAARARFGDSMDDLTRNDSEGPSRRPSASVTVGVRDENRVMLYARGAPDMVRASVTTTLGEVVKSF